MDELGYGINVTGTWHPWAMFHQAPKNTETTGTPGERSRFLAQYAVGRGINRYIQDVNGLGLDATFDPINGFRTIPSYGWFVAYEQWWAKRWASNFTVGGGTWSDLTDTLPDSTYKNATYYTRQPHLVARSSAWASASNTCTARARTRTAPAASRSGCS